MSESIEREKERRLAEERAATAHKLQRKQRLEALVEKRKNNFSYLRVLSFSSNKNISL